MKNKKIFMLSMILLAIFIIGAASASEDIASEDSFISVSDESISEDGLTASEESVDIGDAPLVDLLSTNDLGEGTDDPYNTYVNENKIITDTSDEAYDECAVVAEIILPPNTEDGHLDIFTDDDVEIAQIIVRAAGEGPWQLDENENLKAQVYLRDLDLSKVNNGDNVNFMFFDENGDSVQKYKKIHKIEITDSYIRFAPADFPVSKLDTKLAATKVSTIYNVAKKMVIKLTDENGKALASKKVTVKVGTISKTLITNAKGQASIAVHALLPKTYTATIKFAGDADYEASSVTSRVAVAKATPKLAVPSRIFKVKAKTKKVIAVLKTNTGKVMANTKITLKIGKKIYAARTNRKGVATFNVKLTKKGRYTGVVIFTTNKYYKAVAKKVAITVKN